MGRKVGRRSVGCSVVGRSVVGRSDVRSSVGRMVGRRSVVGRWSVVDRSVGLVSLSVDGSFASSSADSSVVRLTVALFY